MQNELQNSTCTRFHPASRGLRAYPFAEASYQPSVRLAGELKCSRIAAGSELDNRVKMAAEAGQCSRATIGDLEAEQPIWVCVSCRNTPVCSHSFRSCRDH